jgi:hypothetical protein
MLVSIRNTTAPSDHMSTAAEEEKLVLLLLPGAMPSASGAAYPTVPNWAVCKVVTSCCRRLLMPKSPILTNHSGPVVTTKIF